MADAKKPLPPPPPKAPESEKRPSNWQDVQDAKLRAKEDKAPTTKTEMGKRFAKGGSIDGIARRGKTRGKMV